MQSSCSSNVTPPKISNTFFLSRHQDVVLSQCALARLGSCLLSPEAVVKAEVLRMLNEVPLMNKSNLLSTDSFGGTSCLLCDVRGRSSLSDRWKALATRECFLLSCFGSTARLR